MTTRFHALSRRAFLGTAGALVAPGVGSVRLQPDPVGRPRQPDPVVVNDIHSQLNETSVRRIATPRDAADVRALVRSATTDGAALSICGGRHAMGGQQFGSDTVLVDLRSLNRVRAFDAERGTITVDAGVEWPALVAHLVESQRGRGRQWGINQKQTGADRLTIGGALAANAHGRGLRLSPLVGDVESFELVDARGAVRRCSRRENRELFRLAIGGYGLFGIVTTVTLRLVPRRKVQRVVEVRSVDGLMEAFDRRIADGFIYGDFQYDIDAGADTFMSRGVFSCYRPVDDTTPVPEGQKELSDEDWRGLLYLAHTDRSSAFDRYASYYASTSGQVYWSDLHQMSTYLDGYHRGLDAAMGGPKATEMITEIYVPRRAFGRFFSDVRQAFRASPVPIVYGTVRLIERDAETFLPWAREPWACTIFNLHVEHTPAGLERAADAFRTLIDLALRLGGSYFLTYHRWARREQIEAAYPQFADFLRQKLVHDPQERFQSDWWRHYRAMFADRLPGVRAQH